MKNQIKTIAVLLGTSGTGKGTRVSQLQKFFIHKFGDPEIVYFENKGKKKQHGAYFPDVDTYFIGTWTISNKSGLESWTSMDYINSSTGKTDLSIELTRTTAKGNVILEGEPMMLSNKYRPEFMVPHYNLKGLLFSIYNYSNREDYDERILGRSGKKAGEGGWSRNDSYNKVLGKVIEEERKLGLPDFKFRANKHNFDALITQFGKEYLEFIDRSDLIKDFLDYSEENTTLRNINDKIETGIDEWL